MGRREGRSLRERRERDSRDEAPESRTLATSVGAVVGIGVAALGVTNPFIAGFVGGIAGLLIEEFTD